MTTLRTPDDAFAAGYAAGTADPQLSQDQVDYIALLLAPYQDQVAAA